MEKICFAVVAHVDSGKTLLCNQIAKHFYGIENPILDGLLVEKKRGITVKLKQFCFYFKGKEFFFIDTPGHVEFFCEVERSLDVVENVILVIDSTQGIQSQTYILVSMLVKSNKHILVVFNKIDTCYDLSTIDTMKEKLTSLGLKFDSISVSAKKGTNIEQMIDLFLNMKPIHHKEDVDGEIFDIIPSEFGYNCFTKNYIDIKKNDYITLHTGQICKVLAIYKRYEKMIEVDELGKDEVACFLVKSKNILDIKIGEFWKGKLSIKNPASVRSKEITMYFQLYPLNYSEKFIKTVEGILINDPAIEYNLINSSVLGTGFNLGVRGKIHMEIIVERLLNEFSLSDVIITNACFNYRIKTGDDFKVISKPQEFDPAKHRHVQELCYQIRLKFFSVFKSSVIDVLKKNRGIVREINTEGDEDELIVSVPIAEMSNNFYEPIKKLTSGYVTIENFGQEWRDTVLARLEITINTKKVEGLEFLLPLSNAKALSEKLIIGVRNILKQRNFQLKVQSLINGKVSTSNSVTARPNAVASKCYGGDVKRKKKLWDKQKEGRDRQSKNFNHNFSALDFKNIFNSISD